MNLVNTVYSSFRDLVLLTKQIYDTSKLFGYLINIYLNIRLLFKKINAVCYTYKDSKMADRL